MPKRDHLVIIWPVPTVICMVSCLIYSGYYHFNADFTVSLDTVRKTATSYAIYPYGDPYGGKSIEYSLQRNV